MASGSCLVVFMIINVEEEKALQSKNIYNHLCYSATCLLHMDIEQNSDFVNLHYNKFVA